MIHNVSGNILESGAEALVNTVNLVGIMGKGIALQFKNTFPENFAVYRTACRNKEIAIGKLLVVNQSSILGNKYIINFPTKTDWRKPSEYNYIEKGLDDLVRVIEKYSLKSVAIPPLGAGNGGLNWIKVREMIVDKLSRLNTDIFIYEPSVSIMEKMRAERVKLTDARALLLYVLFDLVRQGEFVSEFSSEKICYFLQKFGAKNIFRLDFTPYFYGPYSGKVKYVLNYLNGSYIMGYSDMSKKPFEQLSLLPDAFDTVKSYVDSNSELKLIAERTMNFLNGFYSDFALELMSSVDYILSSCGKDTSVEEIHKRLSKWSDRKGVMFSEKKYIEIARRHILSSGILESV